jgi:hypothetical protein
MSNYFNINKEKSQNEAQERTGIAPYTPTDTLGNQGLTVAFQHVPSGEMVRFKAFITAYNETYSSDWAKEDIFGRADPIFMFKHTTRKVALSFKIPAATLSEGYSNLQRLQKLAKFLYPTYTDVNNSLSISQSPLLRLRVVNLLQGRSAHNGVNSAGQSFNHMTTTGGDGSDKSGCPPASGQNNGQYSPSDGILGVLHNLAINHNLENTETAAMTAGPSGGAVILPRLIEVSVDFTCIHEHHLGWKDGENGRKGFSIPGFPYGVQDDTSAGPSFDVAGAGAAILGSLPTSGDIVNGLQGGFAEARAFVGGLLSLADEDPPLDEDSLEDNSEAAPDAESTADQAHSDSQEAETIEALGFTYGPYGMIVPSS